MKLIKDNWTTAIRLGSEWMNVCFSGTSYTEFWWTEGCQMIVTFRANRRQREMYIGHTRLSVCVSVCLSLAAFPHYCMDLDVTWGNGRGCPLVVHCWADLQSVHGLLRCYESTVSNANVSECLYLLHAWLLLLISVIWSTDSTSVLYWWNSSYRNSLKIKKY